MSVKFAKLTRIGYLASRGKFPRFSCQFDRKVFPETDEPHKIWVEVGGGKGLFSREFGENRRKIEALDKTEEISSDCKTHEKEGFWREGLDSWNSEFWDQNYKRTEIRREECESGKYYFRGVG